MNLSLGILDRITIEIAKNRPWQPLPTECERLRLPLTMNDGIAGGYESGGIDSGKPHHWNNDYVDK